MKKKIPTVKTPSAAKLGTIIVRRLNSVAKHASDPRITAEIKDIQTQVRELENYLDRAHKFWDRAMIRHEESERVTLKVFSRLQGVYTLLKGFETAKEARKGLRRTLALHKAYIRAMQATRPVKARRNTDT
jgi:predicted RNase H-like nuclease